jgi:hypothetical protein
MQNSFVHRKYGIAKHHCIICGTMCKQEDEGEGSGGWRVHYDAMGSAFLARRATMGWVGSKFGVQKQQHRQQIDDF